MAVASLAGAFRTGFVRLEGLLEAEREQLALWIPVGLLAGIGATVPRPPGCRQP